MFRYKVLSNFVFQCYFEHHFPSFVWEKTKNTLPAIVCLSNNECVEVKESNDTYMIIKYINTHFTLLTRVIYTKGRFILPIILFLSFLLKSVNKKNLLSLRLILKKV